MKCYLTFVCLFLTGTAFAQEPMIFFTEPDQIKSFLSKPYKKIEVISISDANSRDTSVTNKKTIYFYGDTACQIIDHSKGQEADTTLYKYDNCGKLIFKKGNQINNRYKNYYRDCRLISRESNELEISFGSLAASGNYTKYKYSKKGELQSELIYEINDTFNILRSTEYSYLNNHIDSVNEFYFVDGEKFRNRSSKYFYKHHLDSIHYFNFSFELIDKMVYHYNEKGRPETIKSMNSKDYNYYYFKKMDPEKIIVGQNMNEYHIHYQD